jgi:hypothetical protein
LPPTCEKKTQSSHTCSLWCWQQTSLPMSSCLVSYLSFSIIEAKKSSTVTRVIETKQESSYASRPLDIWSMMVHSEPWLNAQNLASLLASWSDL